MSMTEEEFWAALAPVESNPVFFRLYYNNDGSPICYSMEDLPHNYIEIDAVTFHQSPPNVRVVDGKMQVINPARYVKKLVPGNAGTPCDPRDICVVVAEDQPHTYWSIKNNETD